MFKKAMHKLSLVAFSVLISSCVSYPYIHHSINNSYINGTIVDNKTKKPISGISVRLNRNTAYTDQHGYFELQRMKENRYFKSIPLIPIDGKWCTDNLIVNDRRLNVKTPRYRRLEIEVYSCRYSSLNNSHLMNKDIEDRLGVIEIYQTPQKPIKK